MSLVRICSSVSHHYVADTKQQLKACLTPPSGPEKFGAVSAVAINFDSTRVLVGYARGPVSNIQVPVG